MFKNSNIITNPFLTIANYFEMLNLNKTITDIQRDELHLLIKLHGFNDGFNKFKFALEIDKSKEKRKKDMLIYDYSIGKFPKQKVEDYIEPNYNPTLEELKNMPVRYSDSKAGVSIILFERIKGWHIVVITAKKELLSEPKIMLSSNKHSGEVFNKGLVIYYRLCRESSK